jgi:hypothetical protein
MNEKNFTPEESLLIISKTIEETRKKIQENGHIIILWGSLIFTVILSQYILELLGLHKKFDIAWTCILFLPGAIYTFFYTWRKSRKNNIPKTILGTIVGAMGWLFGLNGFVLAAIFGDHIGNALAPVLLILLAITTIVIGLSIKFKPLIIGGIVLNLLAIGTFLVNPAYHGFSLMFGAMIGLIIPGILLNIAKKRGNV